MSYREARNHFEKARINTTDAVTIEMLDGLKHLSHVIEEDLGRLQNVGTANPQHPRTADTYRTRSYHVRPIATHSAAEGEIAASRAPLWLP
jgi:hypothetical protein